MQIYIYLKKSIIDSSIQKDFFKKDGALLLGLFQFQI